jgi:hypothetical protein
MSLVLLLLGCSEVEYQVSDPGLVDNPPETTAVVRTDHKLQQPVASADVLFVVDNSDSMAEEQSSLASNFGGFMDLFLAAELDYHLGVIATDMEDPDHSGLLINGPGGLWIDETFTRDDAIDSFAERVQIGTGGSRLEKGLEATYTAIEGLGDGDNAGFYRDDAFLAIVVVSDEDDYSTAISVTTFKTWLEGLKDDVEKVNFSAVVSLDSGCPTEPGLDYIDVAEAFGGVTASICASDWDSVLADLGLAAAGLQREFFLAEVPVQETIEAVVRTDDGLESSFVVGEGLTYSASRNSVTFSDTVPPALSEVFITYTVLSTVSALDTGE